MTSTPSPTATPDTTFTAGPTVHVVVKMIYGEPHVDVYATADDALTHLHIWAVTNWEQEVNGGRSPDEHRTIPADRDEAITAYFDSVEDESYTLWEKPVDSFTEPLSAGASQVAPANPPVPDADEVIVPLRNGWSLRSGVYRPDAPDAFISGEYVRLVRPDGTEHSYWDQDEWRHDPALVMGAILNSAATYPIGMRVDDPETSVG